MQVLALAQVQVLVQILVWAVALALALALALVVALVVEPHPRSTLRPGPCTVRQK